MSEALEYQMHSIRRRHLIIFALLFEVVSIAGLVMIAIGGELEVTVGFGFSVIGLAASMAMLVRYRVIATNGYCRRASVRLGLLDPNSSYPPSDEWYETLEARGAFEGPSQSQWDDSSNDGASTQAVSGGDD